MKKALLIVDLQNDFLPGGALPAPQGDRVIPVINRLQDHFDMVIASRDWHPEGTIHFEKWPAHCVQGSFGASFPAALKTDRITAQLLKGTRNTDDGYSAFEATNISLETFLKEKGIEEIVVCGLTTEYCVRNTVMDALKAGFKTRVIKDAVAAVKAFPGEEEKAWKEMAAAGALITTHEAVTGEKK